MAGETFALAAWAAGGTRTRGSGARATGTVAVEWLDRDGHPVGTAASAPLVAGSPGWHLLTVRAQALRAAAFARICLRAGGDGAAVRFDDVTFVPAVTTR